MIEKNRVTPFQFCPSDSPLLVSMPHSGLQLMPEVRDGLTEQAFALPDTDWFIPDLYDFLVGMGAGFIRANYSRYVIDLNRPVDDKPLYQSKTTGLFPEVLFTDRPVFKPGKSPDENSRARYKSTIWRPYHETIADELHRLKNKFGFAILFDAHSIAAEVPMLFEGVLPDFNWGTHGGASCSSLLVEAVSSVVSSDYSQVINGRFKGGFITREFGRPEQNIHAIQLELSQATYLYARAQQQGRYELDETQFPKIKRQLQKVIEACLATSF